MIILDGVMVAAAHRREIFQCRCSNISGRMFPMAQKLAKEELPVEELS
jgi:hypothetical protein